MNNKVAKQIREQLTWGDETDDDDEKSRQV